MPKNLGGHVTLATPPFGKIFGGRVRTVPGKRLVSNLKYVALTVFELLALTPIDRSLRARTHTHTLNEHIISAIHFVHLAEIIIIIIIIIIMKGLKFCFVNTDVLLDMGAVIVTLLCIKISFEVCF